MKRFGHIGAVLLLGVSLGLHWAALQAVAWTSMLVQRVHVLPMGEAFRTTFDGQHPCPICRIVQEGKAAGRPVDASIARHAPDLVGASGTEVHVPIVVQPPAVASIIRVPEPRSSVPDLPPPRTA